jgi:hypothetical protein
MRPSRSLSFIGMACTFGFYGVLRNLIAGRVGAVAGIGLIAILYARLIWLSGRSQDVEHAPSSHSQGD